MWWKIHKKLWWSIYSGIVYILEVDLEYPKNLLKLHSDLPFLPRKMKIKKCSKITCTILNKENYVIHIRALKQALNNGLILKKYIE